MKKFSFRSFMIFVMCLIVAVLLIGLGIAGVIKFKHRDISNTSANELPQPLQMSADASVVRSISRPTAAA
jgi:hypothetical protein